MRPIIHASLFLLSLLVFACSHDHENGIDPEHAPGYLQHHPVDPESGLILVDTLGYPGNHPTDPVTGEVVPEPVRDWKYVDQSNRPFGTEDLRGKVYVADFFFTSCPTICPKVKSQMLRLEERFRDNPDFRLVSFTIDPKRDTPERMTEYAAKLGIEDFDRWRFIHGDKFEIYDLDEDYLSVALENSGAPGGFDHSGYLVLVDREGFVRSYASGLDEEEVTHLMEDAQLLLDQEDGSAR
ncbi:protein SCO1/2 [Lewinella marina]|uniref:SCO family protein n=1 Tax=Neolewinella marina TaxID=438751 RepID=A0A2G0CE77_9BACT|nr:SCO family protein [Neolewinella marina]NJB87403.1 protein SCO1/2 [Neolewinella marina]PHK98286.1 SCO family protein [Neolewinella marina]